MATQRCIPLFWMPFAVSSLGCAATSSLDGDHSANQPATQSSPDGGAAQGDGGADGDVAPAERPLPPVSCSDPLPVYRDGAQIGQICEPLAAEYGLSVVDLSDSFAPHVFSENPELGDVGEQPYRDTYLALADESRRRGERHLELFGIFPTFRVLRSRLLDTDRHSCHAGVDDTPLSGVEETLSHRGRGAKAQQKLAKQVGFIKARLEKARKRLKLDSIDELEGHEKHGKLYASYQDKRGMVDAVAAVQEHLRCDGHLRGKVRRGSFNWATGSGLRAWQQRHMIVARGELDEWTRQAIVRDSRDNDFHAVLRALRERVVDATGIIEDGSAAREWGLVLGIQLNADGFRYDSGQPAAPNPASDLVSPATEAAAQALGWTSADAFLAFFEGMGETPTSDLRVALPLPTAPAYHSSHMDIRAEIHRGDVYYQFGGRRQVDQRPVLTVYAQHGDQEVALMRWGTTIGGWQPEIHPSGGVGQRYKNSPPGERIWRDVVASPAWLPPPSTPDDELVSLRGERLVPNRSLFGPGYRSAYGLAMMMHHEPLPPRREGEEPRFRDQGIRTHGSVSYRSILGGNSHGCHRLFNHLAVRLSSFLIRHRNHVRQGSIVVDYGREVEMEGQSVAFRITSRGYLFELTPPVPINVLEGNILGRREEPSKGFRAVRRPEPEEPEIPDGPVPPAATEGAQ